MLPPRSQPLPHRPLSLAVHDFVVPWIQADWPLVPAALFGREAPLVLEAGFGNGDFLVDLARGRPERDFLGIEISWGSIQRLLRRLDAEGLTNVRVLQGDAGFLIANLLPPDSLAEVIANFSDPWRKSRHHRRRLIQRAFLADLRRRLEPGGRVTIATDHAEYADWIAEVLENQDLLVPVLGSTRMDAIPGRRPTKYETKALARGERIHYFLWQRPAGPPSGAHAPVEAVPEPPPPAQLEKAGPMPNVLIQGHLPPGEDPWGDAPLPELAETHRGVDVRIKLTGRYRESAIGDWLVTVLVTEGPFNQSFAVLLASRPDHRHVVKLAPVGSPRPTRGVKRAVWYVAKRLLERHPGLAVVSNTVDDL